MVLVNINEKKLAEEVIKNSTFLVLHFFADWVLQCQNMNDVMTEMSKLTHFSGVKFVKLPAEEVPEVSLQYNIAAVPTIILFKDGAQVDRVEGANPAALREKIKAMVGNTFVPKDINERLKDLIKSSPVMLFMKGNSREPKCGFSRQIVEILLSFNVLFKTFDILSDQEIREALKVYSSWPTYPQLYINGELIGGLDIVKEMEQSGELMSKLPRIVPLETRLTDLINSGLVMVFMKGNKENPKCGFSRQLVQLLEEANVDFGTFDILTDDEIREGLKEYSDWPTYPQLYIKGQLIGGLDICKELKQSGELKQLLP